MIICTIRLLQVIGQLIQWLAIYFIYDIYEFKCEQNIILSSRIVNKQQKNTQTHKKNNASPSTPSLYPQNKINKTKQKQQQIKQQKKKILTQQKNPISNNHKQYTHMHSVKSNFLQRFSGKIACVDRTGKFSSYAADCCRDGEGGGGKKYAVGGGNRGKYNPSSTSNSNYSKYTEINLPPIGNPSKLTNPKVSQPRQTPTPALHRQSQSNSRSSPQQYRSQVSSFYTQTHTQNHTHAHTHTHNHKPGSDGANDAGNKMKASRLELEKMNSLRWEIEDRDTREFYDQLTRIQLVKTSSEVMVPRFYAV